MPYIVTTKQSSLEAQFAREQQIHAHAKRTGPTIGGEDAVESIRTATPEVSRRAVATLAKKDVPELAHLHDHTLARLAEQGDTVTLPDGTVVEVERVGLNDLRITDGTLGMSPGEVIANYNEAQT